MPKRNTYENAKAGGRHAGLLRTYRGKRTAELQRALRSYEQQVELHRRKVSDPWDFVKDWEKKNLHTQQGLLQHWKEDLSRNQELADIMRGILQERGIQA